MILYNIDGNSFVERKLIEGECGYRGKIVQGLDLSKAKSQTYNEINIKNENLGKKAIKKTCLNYKKFEQVDFGAKKQSKVELLYYGYLYSYGICVYF